MPEIPKLPVLNSPQDNDSFLHTYEFSFNIKSKETVSFILSLSFVLILSFFQKKKPKVNHYLGFLHLNQF